MAEVCGERGYAESSVAEVSRRAGVSTASFYRQFKDKSECMLASFEELFGRLLAAIERACAAESGEEKIQAGARTAAALLADDPPTARLLSIEIAALGPVGVRAQQEAIERLAALLRGPERPATLDAAWITASAMNALLAMRLAEGNNQLSFENLLLDFMKVLDVNRRS